MIAVERDVVRATLSVLLIGAMIGASFLVLRPFLASAVWATMTVIASWPLMLFIQRKLWNKRGLAAAVMTCLFLIIFIFPILFAIGTIVQNADQIINWARLLGNLATPEAPDWLKALPYVGKRIAGRWQEIAATTPEEIRDRILPHLGTFIRWFLGQVGNLGSLLLHFLITLIIAAVLYLKGEAAAAAVNEFARRIAGIRGEESVRLAGQAIRAVAMGVVASALLLAAFTWAGLMAAGIPGATLLTAISFMLAIAQLGTVPVLLCASLWLYWSGDIGWAAVLVVWSCLASALDHFLRPFLIKKSGNLSLILVFPGVIGGLISFGFIGIFVGPVVLAVAYTLLAAWVRKSDAGAYDNIPEEPVADRREVIQL